MTENELSRIVYNQGMRVHRELGLGLIEKVYEECLFLELVKKGLKVDRQKAIPISYLGEEICIGFRADLIVNDKLLIELKAVQDLHPLFFSQTLTYLKMTNLKLGLLINFNVPQFKNGVKRVINGHL